MAETAACASAPLDHEHCSGEVLHAGGPVPCDCVCHRGQAPRGDAWLRATCARCSHPRLFHGRRRGYADACVGAHGQPRCPCRAFVDPAPVPGYRDAWATPPSTAFRRMEDT